MNILQKIFKEHYEEIEYTLHPRTIVLENIEKMISPVVGTQPKGRDGKEPVLVRISVASSITGYSVNYLYHLASTGTIPCVKRGRTLRFDADELKQWMRQQYVPASNRLPDEKEKR